MTTDSAVEPEPGPAPDVAVEASAKKSSSLLNAPATYVLLAINFIVFALTVPHGPIPGLWHARSYGAIFTEPFAFTTLTNFGGSEGTLVLGGQWWRLLTATFVHANLLHILINMWCLWNLGVLGEPLLGRQGLIATYVLTGVGGNLLSLASNALTAPHTVVVGASGAVFGIAGMLIVLLSNRALANESLTWKDIRGLRRSVVLFALLNLAFGMAPRFVLPLLPPWLMAKLHVDLSALSRVDNSAHLGGLLMGLAMGAPLFARMMSGRTGYRARQRHTFAAATLVLALFAYGIHAFETR